MGRSEISETRAFLRLVTVTLTVLGVLTAVNFLVIMNHVGSNIFTPLKRNLASVTTIPRFNIEKVSPPIIEVNCAKSLGVLRIKTRAINARVVFKNCVSVGRVQNQNNHSTGEVFMIDDRHWTSDFLTLDEGANKLVIALGDKSQVIEITREIPNKPKANKAL